MIEDIKNKYSKATGIPSPIALDLDGDGIETISVNKGGFFDHAADGFAERTGWVSSDDGLLVRDIDGNGTIDSGRELFGSETLLSNGQKAANGFEALRELDSNGDGAINANDAVFSELRVWKDLDGDGLTSEGELLTLEEGGLKSINVNYTNSGHVDAQGNAHKQIGSYTTTDGLTRAATDVWVRTDTTYSVPTEWTKVPEDIALLPDARGYGKVRNLHQAMSMDATGELKALVTAFTQATTPQDRDALVTQIIYRWTGVQNVDPTSRASRQIYGNAIGDARKLEALEEFMGEEWVGIWCWGTRDPNPHGRAAPVLLQAWDELKALVHGQLMSQSHLSGLFQSISYHWDAETESVVGDLSVVAQTLTARIDYDRDAGLDDLGDFLYSLKGMGLLSRFDVVSFKATLQPLGADVVQTIDSALSGRITGSPTEGDDVVRGTAYTDDLNGLGGNDRLLGKDGNDTLAGGTGNDFLNGGTGNDTLRGDSGADTYVYARGYGNDTVRDYMESGRKGDVVRFTGLAPADIVVSLGAQNSLVFTIRDTNETLTVLTDGSELATNGVGQYQFDDGTVWSHDDVLRATVTPTTDANDVIQGIGLQETLSGKGGDDILIGNGGDDVLDGGAGNDTLIGSSGYNWIWENGSYRVERNFTSEVSANGNDTYLFGHGDGQDTITDGDWIRGNQDTLRFKDGVTPSEVQWTRTGVDLVLKLRGSSDQVTVKNYFGTSWNSGDQTYRIERIAFADGTALSYADVQAKLLAGSEDSETIVGSSLADVMTGQGGDDILLGGSGSDILDGGSGNDVLRGGAYLGWQNQIFDGAGEGDTYRFGRGDGHDTIIEDSWKSGEIDRIEFKEGVAAADVRLEFIRTVNGWQVSDDLKITIRDTGETLTVKNHFNASNRNAVEEIAFADGTVLDLEAIKSRTLLGEDGNDTLRGYADRDDNIQGAGGDDNLVGFSGNDTLDGGTGNDNLDAGTGDDTLSGGTGNDVHKGGYGADTYRWGAGDGQDVIEESYDASTDVLEVGVGIVPEDLTVRWTIAGDMTVTLPDGSRVLVRGQANPWSNELGIEQVRFADGTVWDRNALATRALSATVGDDSIVGGYADDTLVGGAGNDNFSNLGGFDTYQFGLGDGTDTIQETYGALQFKAGINQNDVNFSRDGNDLIVSLANSTDSVRLKNWLGSWRRIENFDFDNGAHLSIGDVFAKLNLSDQDEVLFGSPGADSLEGTDKNTVAYGREGNDVLTGSSGSDLLFGEQGDDDLSGNADSDTLRAGEGNDVLAGGAGSDYLYGEQGDDILSGNADNDVLEGGEGDDTLDGGSGRDTLFGTQGNNTYIVTRGMELDNVYAEDQSVASDTVVFGAGIRPEDVSIQLGEASGSWDVQPGDVGYTNLVIGVGGDDALVIRNNAGGDLGRGAVQRFIFADGTEWTLADVVAHADGGFHGWHQRNNNDPTTLVGSVGDDEVYDYTGQSLTVQVRANNDNVNVGAGNDLISAGSGNDDIAAGDGDNLVAGETGNDSMRAGRGNDVFVFNYGDGQDSVRFGDGVDTLSLGAGIALDMLSAKRNADGHLVLTIDGGAGGEVVLEGTYLQDYEGDLEHIQFVTADGSVRVFDFAGWLRSNTAVLLASDIDQPTAFDGAEFELTATVAPAGNLEAIAYAQTGDLFGTAVLGHNTATDGADVLYGTNASDTIDAGGGDDMVLGLAGDDILSGGAGNDGLYGGDGNDTLDGNTGNDVIFGGWGADLLNGGGGSDTLYGEWGGDTYVFQAGQGKVTIEDAHRSLNMDGGEGGYGGSIIDDAPNILSFGAGIRPEDLRYSELNGDLVIEFANQQGDRIVLRGYEPARATQTSSIDIFRFADGTEIAVETIDLVGETVVGGDDGAGLYGTNLADTLIGGDGDDYFEGQGGADRMVGGIGSDTYFVTKEWGSAPTEVVIAETWRAQDFNRVEINGDVNPQELQLEFDGSDLVLRYTAQGDTIRFAGFDPRQEGMGLPVDQVSLSWQGVTLSFDDLLGRGIRIIGTERDDVLVGTALADWIEGLEENDTLVGGAGGDVYVFEAGDGTDTIIDVESGDAPNTVILPEGTDLEDIRLSYDGEGFLVLSFANIDDRIRLSGFEPEDPLGPHAVERFRFGVDGDEISYADLIARGFDIVGTEGNDALKGTILTDRIQGGNGNDLIEATAGGDLLSGQGGNDAYVVNLGNGVVTIDDIAQDQAGNVLRFGEGISPDALRNNLRFESDGNGGHVLLIPYGNDGDVVRLMGFNREDVLGSHAVDRFEFADGSSVDYATLVSWTFAVDGTNADDALVGTSVADRLTGYDGNDVLQAGLGSDELLGGAGDDVLVGGLGDDAYVFNIGDGNDTIVDEGTTDFNYIRFGPGIVQGDISIEWDNTTLVVHYSATDAVRIENFQTVDGIPTVMTLAFEDGSVMSLTEQLNKAPILDGAVESGRALEDQAFSFTLPEHLFRDLDVGDEVQLSVKLSDGSPLPAWLTFNRETRTLSGTPQNSDVGDIELMVIGTDHFGLSASTAFTVHVQNTNDAPVVVVPVSAQQATEDLEFSFVVPVDAFLDVDAGDQLTFIATLANGEPLPSWLDFDAATGTFSGNPANADVGSLQVRVTATDVAGAQASQTFQLSVANTNDAPETGSIVSGQQATQDATFSFTVPADAFIDVDAGDTLVVTAMLDDGSALPDWLRFDAQTQTFSGIPANADVGSLQVRVTATDRNGAQVSQTFALDVANVNDAPVVGSTLLSQHAIEDATFSYTLAADSFQDIDAGDSLNFNATLENGEPLPSWLSFDPVTQTFSGTPMNGDVGAVQVRVTATDMAGASATQVFALTIANSNDAPTAQESIGAQTAVEDAVFTYVLPVNAFNDVDVGDRLTYSATLSNGDPLPNWLTLDALTGVFTGTPGNSDVGALQIRVIATDASGAQASQSLDLAVTNTNDAPEVGIVIDGQQASEDQAFTFALPAGAFRDVDANDPLTLFATLADGSALPSWLRFNAQAGIFSGTPMNGDVAPLQVRVTATDQAGATAMQLFSLGVSNTNDAPQQGQVLSDQQATEDAAFVFVVPQDSFSDVDAGDALTLTATMPDGTALPSWLRFDAATRTFSGTPLNGDVGSFAVRLTATDSADANASQTVAFTVANTNDAPTVSVAVGSMQATEDASFVFTVPQTSFNDVDAGDSLTLSASLPNGTALPAWLHFDAATRTFSGTPTNGDVGNVSVLLTATDSSGAQVSQTIALSVANVNDAPTAGSAIANQTGRTGTALSWQLPGTAFVDMDAGDVLTYSAHLADGSALPNWLQIDPATGAFTGTPPSAGTYVFQITSTDRAGAQASQTFTATIDAATGNQAPVTEADSATVAEDTKLLAWGNVLTNDSDPEGKRLSVADAGVRRGTYGVLTLLSNGTYAYVLDNCSTNVQGLGAGETVADTFTYTANDGAQRSTGVLTITVQGRNDAPDLARCLTDVQLAKGKSFAWTVPAGSFVDADRNDKLTFVATLSNGGALPSWLKFDAATQTFSGTAPSNAKGSIDVRVAASDGHGDCSTATDVFKISFGNKTVVSQGNEGVGNGDDAPPPGHDYNHNDGQGTSPGHPGNKGGAGRDEDDAFQRFLDGFKAEDKKASAGYPALDRHWLEDCLGNQRPEETGYGRENNDVERHWNALTHALNRMDAERQSAPSWNHASQGADVSGLAGMLHGNDSQRRGGADSISLACSSGTQLKGFTGIKEGVGRLPW